MTENLGDLCMMTTYAAQMISQVMLRSVILETGELCSTPVLKFARITAKEASYGRHRVSSCSLSSTTSEASGCVATGQMSMRASKVMGCTLRVLRFTRTSTPLLENLGMQITRVFCPSGPEPTTHPHQQTDQAARLHASHHQTPEQELSCSVYGTMQLPACRRRSELKKLRLERSKQASI